ncbi:MOP flippase family protein [Deferrisoma camini]|uniref:MOP flippase family protein n=1 Tax=Deferrisoma camini TaxID=1035120 RepID=UPI00046D140B|nr:MOP flippase family protein [Deferrisoma camini]
MSLLREIAKGAAWTAASRWLSQATQVVVSVIVARLLSPEDYGLMGMSAAFTGFVVLFANLGMGPALVHADELDEPLVHTAVWSTLGVAAVLYVLSFAAAPMIGAFFNEPRVVPVIRVAALAFLVGPAAGVLSAVLTHDMRFRALGCVDLAGAWAGQMAALIAAWQGFGVWSLVAASLTQQCVRLGLLLRITRYRPRLWFDRLRFKALFSYGSNILGSNILGFFGRNADNLLIGRYLGAQALGYYDLAYQIMMRPIVYLSGTVTRPLFPALSKLKHDKKKAAETYMQVIGFLALLTTPVMLGVASVAPEFVHVVLGEKWGPAVPLIQILAVVGALQCVGTTVGDIYQSQGRTDLMFKLYLFGTPMVVLVFWVGVRWGVLGVALTYAAWCFAYAGLSHAIANHVIGLPNRRFLQTLLPSTLASLVMVGAVWGGRVALTGSLPMGLPRLVVLVAVGVVVYVGVMVALGPPEVASLRALARERIARWQAQRA